MTLVYLTAQKYPSKKTEPFFWKSMAQGFYRVLGSDFTFAVRDTPAELLRPMRVESVRAPKRFVAVYYFFMLPCLMRRKRWHASDTVFFAQDSYLLAVLSFWKGVPGFSYILVSDWHQLFGDWRDRYIARRSDVLVTTSKRLKEVLHDRTNVPQEKIVVAYGGVDLMPFAKARQRTREELRRELQVPQGAHLVGYAGSILSVAGGKGLEVMIEALAHLPAEYTVVLAGERRGEFAPYQALAERLGVASRCIFRQWLPYEKYAAFQVAMDVLVIPYPDAPHYRDYGFPMKAWEYLAAGRPIVYSDLPIIAEALKECAVPFAPGDAVALSCAIEEACGKDALQNVKKAERYTWEARAAFILEHIRAQS